MIARLSGFEQLAAAYVAGRAATSFNPDQVKAARPGARLATALAAWEVQAHRTLAANPDPADLVRVARMQALITSSTSVLIEAAARKGHIDGDLLERLMPALEADHVAWSRLAKRWGELTSPASRTDPALVAAASEARAAIAATAANQNGWTTPCHRRHQPGCRRGRSTRPQRYDAISQARSSCVSRTLSRVPSDHSLAKAGAKRAKQVNWASTPVCLKPRPRIRF